MNQQQNSLVPTSLTGIEAILQLNMEKFYRYFFLMNSCYLNFQGTTELNAALQKSEGVSQLCQVLGDKVVKAELRQCAAAMLRRHLMPNKHWQRLSPDTKQAYVSNSLGVIALNFCVAVTLAHFISIPLFNKL